MSRLRRTTMQSSIPNIKNLSQEVLKQDFFILPMYFYASNPGAPGVRPFCSLGPWFEQTWYSTTMQCNMPNLKHLRPVVLNKQIFKYFSMYFYDLNLGPSGAGTSWTLGPSLNKFGKGPLGNATYQISCI